MPDWNKRFLGLANSISEWSKDKTTKVGCVIVGDNNIVLSSGYNGFPRGVNDSIPERHERPEKYMWTEHAERNAIYNAARKGISLEGSVMYLPWFPCVDCARAIVQTGISKLVCYKPDFNDQKWGNDFVNATAILEEGGVTVCYVNQTFEGDDDDKK